MMLRPTLVRWIESKRLRPITRKVAHRTVRGSSVNHGTSHTATGAASSPLYHTGDMDDVDEPNSHDMLDDVTDDPYSLSVSTAPRHNLHPPAPRSRAANTYSWPSTAELEASDNGTVEHRTRQKTEGKSGSPTRRVITTARRPHGASSEPPSTAHHAHAHPAHEPLSSSPREAQFLNRAKVAPHYKDSGYAAAAEGPAGASIDASSAMDEAAVSVGATATAAKSSDAYRFLLHHIDAEIAALQRRHASVTTRRQSIQTHQTQRVRELFEVIENPWTLLPTEVQPALPATGLDVYIKEQQIARRQPNPSHTPSEGQDKMYVLALHKNYRAMPAGRKRFYEEAARYNAALREELKYQLTRGCSRFEEFLDTVKECTMEMAQEGQVPALPTTRAQNRFHATRSVAPNHRHTNAARASPGGGEVKTTRGRRSHQQVRSQLSSAAQETFAGAEAEAEEEDADAAAEDEDEATDEEAVGGAAKEAGRAVRHGSAGLGGGRRASKRIKSAAKKARAKAAAAPTGARSFVRESKKRQGAQTSAKNQLIAKPPRKGKKSNSPNAGGNGGGGSKKTASRVVSGVGVSRSIPLPNLDHLAVKKIKQMITAPSSGGGAAKKSKKTSTSLKTAAGSKKKKGK
ncbi:hypothetical protein JKF63_03990 [Porcisia hertigi]|uniref:Uncharacterized protein n=1 Tax=Porcisia hertigi TaxID=2761500 RepID=A0A836HUC5_9TRYP|nr:hypothetical protein JKF63_03990 [Porcisia hertigi]